MAEFTLVTCPTQPESLPVHITCQKCPQATISQRHEINNDRAAVTVLVSQREEFCQTGTGEMHHL